MLGVLARWQGLVARRPDLADAGRALLYQFGVGLAFLATIRRDGGPRLHPVCPFIVDGGLYLCLVPSLKRVDLHRDRRFALHSYPCPGNEDEFYITGQAFFEADPTSIERLRAAFLTERDWTNRPPPGCSEQQVCELLIDRILLTRTTGHADFNPVLTIWRSDQD
jgi:hypothetical protein